MRIVPRLRRDLATRLMALFAFWFFFIMAAVAESTSASSTSLAPDQVQAPLVVAFDDDYPPYSFKDEDGQIEGIVPELWAAWSRSTGRRVTLLPLPWDEALAAFESGKAEVLDTVFENASRRVRYLFSQPYATIKVPVFVHNGISGISEAEDLRGFRVAVKKGDAAYDMLRALGVADLDTFANYKDIIAAAGAKEVRIFCMDQPPALYYLYKSSLDRDYHKAFLLYTGAFHRAVLRTRPDLLALVDRGFDDLPKATTDAINRKWLGSPLGQRIDFRLLALVGAIAFTGLAALLFLVRSLRNRIRVATQELRGKLEELELSERKNRAFIAALPDLFFIIDRQGRFVDLLVSDQTKPAYRPEDFIGKTPAEIGLPPSAVEALAKGIGMALAGDPLVVFDYRVPVAGRNTTYHARIVPFTGGMVLLVATDVTSQKRQEELLRHSLEEKDALLHEIHHRVKNNMQIMSSLISLQMEDYKEQADRKRLATTLRRIRSMAMLYEHLCSSAAFDTINAAEYLLDIVQEVSMGLDFTRIDIAGGESIPLSLDQAVPFGLIAHELVANAATHAYRPDESGRVSVSFSRRGTRIVLSVEDQGAGLPLELAPDKVSTMGFTLITALSRQLHGSIRFERRIGLFVELSFPVSADEEDFALANPELQRAAPAKNVQMQTT